MGIYYRIYYHRYPELVQQLCSMAQRYNEQMLEIERLGEEGKVFVFRPVGNADIKMLEQDSAKLRTLYLEGKRLAKQKENALRNYLEY